MKIIYTLSVFLLLNSLLTAQVRERSATMSLGVHNSFSIDLPGAKKKMAEKQLKEYLKEFGKVQRNKKAKEYYVTDVIVPAIATNGAVSIYAKLDEGRNMSEITVWVNNGTGYISSDDIPTEAEGVEVFLNDYATKVRKEVIKKEIEDEEDRLKDLEKDLKKLAKKNKDYYDDIAKANKKIAEAEQNIENNLIEQDEKMEEIDGQKKVLESVINKLNSIGRDN